MQFLLGGEARGGSRGPATAFVIIESLGQTFSGADGGSASEFWMIASLVDLGRWISPITSVSISAISGLLSSALERTCWVAFLGDADLTRSELLFSLRLEAGWGK